MSEMLPTIEHQATATPVTFKLPADIEAHIVRLREIDGQVTNLGQWMDIYCIDGFGGFIPIVGDISTSAVKLWLFAKAHEAGVPASGLAKIGGLAVVDLTVGLVPAIGDVLDFFIRSNLVSARIVHAHVDQRLKLIEDARLRAGLVDDVPGDHPAFRDLRMSLALAA